MPLYAYRCTECGHKFEKIQSFSSTIDLVCPQCGGPLERPLTAPGLSFKGAGWYVNDYASKPSSSENSSETKKPAETKTESAPASESKPTSSEPAAKPASTPSSSTT